MPAGYSRMCDAFRTRPFGDVTLSQLLKVPQIELIRSKRCAERDQTTSLDDAIEIAEKIEV